MAGSLKRQALPDYRLEYLGMFCSPYAQAPDPLNLPQPKSPDGYVPDLHTPAPTFIYFDPANPYSITYSLNSTVVTDFPAIRVSG